MVMVEDASVRPVEGAELAEAPQGEVPSRVRVQKAYKMYVGGQFVRSESGRYLQVKDVAGDDVGAVENYARASRKDGRDAVRAAYGAVAGWSAKTAYNRGQIIYRLGEVLEGRSSELAASLRRSLGVSLAEARDEVEQSIDRVVSYAGWADKYQSLLSTLNPVAGPHFTFSLPEPMGVVAVVAPTRPSLLGLVTALMPIIVSGNTVVALASDEDPRTAVIFSECLATSDLPGGVINILTGQAAEVAPHLAKHQEVAAIDLWLHDEALTRGLEEAAVGTVKRARKHSYTAADLAADGFAGLRAIERFVETKTIWHPVGV